MPFPSTNNQQPTTNFLTFWLLNSVFWILHLFAKNNVNFCRKVPNFCKNLKHFFQKLKYFSTLFLIISKHSRPPNTNTPIFNPKTTIIKPWLYRICVKSTIRSFEIQTRLNSCRHCRHKNWPESILVIFSEMLVFWQHSHTFGSETIGSEGCAAASWSDLLIFLTSVRHSPSRRLRCSSMILSGMSNPFDNRAV